MARRPRVEVDGGVYHVYNRVASGEPVFANPEEAVEFIERIRSVKTRDGWRCLPGACSRITSYALLRISSAMRSGRLC